MMVIGVATNFRLERSEVEQQMRPFLRQGDKFGGMDCGDLFDLLEIFD